MINKVLLSIICILTFTSFLTLGCDRIRKPTNISAILAQTDELPVDPDEDIPTLPQTAELDPGKYRMRVGQGTFGEEDGKIYRLIYSVDDKAAGCVLVEILLDPQPKSETPGNVSIFEPNLENGKWIFDAVVVEITEKRDVSPRLIPEGPNFIPDFAVPQEPCTVHVYDGRLIKNLSNPEVVFQFEDELRTQ
ncbi:MAG: hypothetical protein OXD54_04235 [Candidatus Poribacteria bacterium]|nr:hypothetical protein [Candidatus Poribacteria bacterium]